MKIIILFDDPFPIGMAATNRVISISKGILENGADVSVLCLNPYELEGKEIININAEGVYHGIKFKYLAGTTIWPQKNINKLAIRIKSFVNSVNEIIRSKSENNIDAIILCSNRPTHILFYFVITFLLKIKYVQEKSEFPFILKSKNSFGKVYEWFYTTFIYKLFDGMFVMTTPLKEYFENRIRKNAKITVIPMTVEGERFSKCADSPPFPFPYIGYCGYMGGNKDGVDILIKAFKIVADKFKDIHLVLIGDAKKDDIAILKKLVVDFKLNDRVVFTGKIERDRMPSLLCHANILALARPSSLQSLGGFPTKLGEYLATGNPVVVTKVGEIPSYLRDGENAFLVEPDSAKLFAEKLEFVLSNPEVAIKVGEKGSDLVHTHFNYQYQSKRILEFLIRV